jgi:hypothetical protein
MTWDRGQDDEVRETGVAPTCLAGCLVVLVLVVVSGAGVVWYLFKKGPAMLAEFARGQIVEAVEESELPKKQKQQIVQQVNRVVEAFQAGEIDGQDLERAIEAIVKSPIMGLLAVLALNEEYVKPSGLSEEEKTHADLILQRVARGVIEEQLKLEQLRPAMHIIAAEKRPGEWELKKSVSDHELRDFLDKCNDLADGAQLSDEPFQVDVGAEVKRIVDKVLASGEWR